MKNIYKCWLVVIAMAVVGCTTDSTDNEIINVVPGTTYLVVDMAAPHTKVTLGDKGADGRYSTLWSEGDKISVNGHFSKEVVINPENPSSAKFEVETAVLDYPYQVVYPASSNSMVEFKAVQNYVANTFESGVAPMYGSVSTKGEVVKLKHLSGILKLSIKGADDKTTIERAIIKSEDGYIAGLFSVDFATGAITPAESMSDTMEYLFGAGLELSSVEPKSFFVVLPHGEFGLCSLELHTTDNRVMYLRFKTSGGSAIKAGVVREFGAITFKNGAKCALEPLESEEDEFIISDISHLKKPATIDGEYLVLNDVNEFMWVCYNGQTVGGVTYNKIRIGADIEMGKYSTLVALPSMNLVDGTEIDGNNKSITGVNLRSEASSLFGDADNLNIHNLTLTDCTVNTALQTGAGILVGMVSEGLTVSDVTFNNCSVTAPCKIGLVAGALHTGTFHISGVTANSECVVETSYISGKSGMAGGLVGCIAKNGDGATVSTATFTNCTTSATVKSYMEATNSFYGKMVGQLGGYNNDEKLYFVNCSGTNATLVPMYDTGKKYAQTARLSFNEAYRADFCTTTLNDATNDLLGGERLCRGMVYFEGNRFVSEWDGKRTATMIKDADGRNLVYSPYDLAKAQGTSYGDTTGIVFMTSVDMGGHTFKPINYVRYLDGGGFELHNLKVVRTHDAANQRGAAFIIYASGTTVHKDLTFVGADITCNHDATVAAPAYGDDKDGGAGNAYAGTLVSRSWRSSITDADGNTTGYTTYTISNIHARSGKVRGVCKVGGLVGAMRGEIIMDNCSVDNYVVENYDPMVVNYYKMKKSTSIVIVGDLVVEGLQWWYTAGECGGLIGFLEANSANISNCSVTNTAVNCTGQPNKDVIANIWAASAYTEGAYTSGTSIKGNATTTIAGRHVNQFIGDVRSRKTEAQVDAGTTDYTMTISDYTVSGNSYNGISADGANDYNHNYASGSYCEIAGCVYYVGVDIGSIKHVNECAGTFTFNAKGGSATTLTEAVGSGDNMGWFGGNCKDLNFNGFTNKGTSYYPVAPTE